MGYVTAEKYVPLLNAASAPESFGELAKQDIGAMLAAPALAFVHSHPDGWLCPSAVDMQTQRQWAIPFIVLPIGDVGPIGAAFAWGDGKAAPLLDRPFRHGIFDCVTLIRDWYRAERGIEFVDEPRDWDWWSTAPDLDLYRACYQREGFEEIPLSEATRVGDVIFYAIRSAVPQHAAVVVQDGVICHHIAGAREFEPTRRSCLDSRIRWSRFATMAVRHA